MASAKTLAPQPPGNNVWQRVTALIERAKQTRIARALSRYSVRNGGILCNGMALTTLLSLTAALTVGWTVFMAVLGSNQMVKSSVTDTLSTAMPGLIKTGDGSGLINLDTLTVSSAITPASVIAFLIMVWSAMGVVGALGSSIRAMFGLVAVPENIVKKTARNLIGLAGVGVTLLVTSVVSVITTRFSSAVFTWMHLDGQASRVLVQVAATIVSMLADALLLVLLVRVVSGVRIPRPDLAWGAFGYAAASSILRFVGTRAVSAPTSAVLATAATIITLVLWIALQVRVILTVSAWMANPPAPVPVEDADALHFTHTPNFVTQSAPETLRWPHNLATGELQVEVDR